MKTQRERDSCREQVLGRAFCSSSSYKHNEGGRQRVVRIVKKEEAYKEDEKYERGESNRLFFWGVGVYKCYVHYIFSTLSKQIINDRLLVVVINRQKVISVVNSN